MDNVANANKTKSMILNKKYVLNSAQKINDMMRPLIPAKKFVKITNIMILLKESVN